MTKLLLLAMCLLIGATILEASPPYTTKYDNVNVDKILKDDRQFNSYFNCIMEKPDVKCNPEATELKSLGLIVLSKAFNTFANMPAELQPVINDLHNTIRKEYAEEIDKFQNFKVTSRK